MTNLLDKAIVLHGADYSVYTRIILLVLYETELPFNLIPVDIFSEEGVSSEYLTRHPFAKIPLLEHGDFTIYETDAIVEYVLSLTDHHLLPDEAILKARVRQIMRITDNYAYPQLIWKHFVPEIEDAKIITDKERLNSDKVLAVLDNFCSEGRLINQSFSLADCWLVPVLDYYQMTEKGRCLAEEYPNLFRWWLQMQKRESVKLTAFKSV